MHIPTCQTQDLEILTFQQALGAHQWGLRPDEVALRAGLLCRLPVPPGDQGEKSLICIGINPSTAAPGDLDNLPSSRWSASPPGQVYDSFLMFNVYAQRATPAGGHGPGVQRGPLHRENMAAFRYVLEQVGAGYAPRHVWAAWGTIIEKRPTSGTASGTWWPSGGGVRGPVAVAGKCSQERPSPPPPSTCGKRRKCGPLHVVPYLDSL